MTMGRSAAALPRPEDADSWGEFNARLECETDSLKSPITVWWWTAAVALFGAGVMLSGYALTDRDWWLFPCALAPLLVAGVMSVREFDRATRARTRAAELDRLRDAWLDHLHGGSPW
jgi:hypothetical protein